MTDRAANQNKNDQRLEMSPKWAHVGPAAPAWAHMGPLGLISN